MANDSGETVSTGDRDITKGKCNIVHVFTASVKSTNILEDVIDEMCSDGIDEREIIQRWLCMPPMFDLEKNSVLGISKKVGTTRWYVYATIDKFKQKLWEKMNGKNTNNN